MPQGSTSPGDKEVRKTLKLIGARSRGLVYALFLVYLIIAIVIGAASGLAIADFITVIVCITAVFIVGLALLTKIEMKVEETKQKSLPSFGPSPATPDSAVLNGLVKSTLEVICRTTCLPDDPQVAGMRAFIFKVEGDELVCRYYWALNPTTEEVNVTRFELTEAVAKQVAVVECVMKKTTIRKEVQPLSAELSQEKVPVESELRYVLAAPIWNKASSEVWGTVDFDASNNLGRERLSSEAAKAAILQLTQHLRVIFNLTEEPAADGGPKPAGRVRRRRQPKAVGAGAAKGKAEAKPVAS